MQFLPACNFFTSGNHSVCQAHTSTAHHNTTQSRRSPFSTPTASEQGSCRHVDQSCHRTHQSGITRPEARSSPAPEPEGWLVRSQNWRAAAPEDERANQPPRSGHIRTRERRLLRPFQLHMRGASRAWAAMLLGSWSSMRSSAQVTELLL